MMRIASCLLAVMLGSAPFASNGFETIGPSLSEIRAQQVDLHQQALAKRGIFKDLSENERQQLLTRQNQFLAMTEGRQSLGDLKPDDRVQVVNTLEWINAAITRAEDERLVCERVKLTGSNRPERVCKTVAQRNAERNASVKMMEDQIRTRPVMPLPSDSGR